MSVRLHNRLREAGLSDLREVATWTRADFLRCSNFGLRSLGELEAILDARGLRLGMTAREVERVVAKSSPDMPQDSLLGLLDAAIQALEHVRAHVARLEAREPAGANSHNGDGNGS